MDYHNRKSLEDSAKIAGWCVIGAIVFIMLRVIWLAVTR